jgi:hypothetical protein
MDYPQIKVFMQEIIRVYGDMQDAKNRARALANSGLKDKETFDMICKIYYDNQQPQPKEGKKK